MDLQFRRNESLSVGKMLAFCSGEDEDICFFHGFTIAPDYMAGQVTLEGFEASVPVAPERRAAFLKFNCRGETEVTEEGICWCWYD